MKYLLLILFSFLLFGCEPEPYQSAFVINQVMGAERGFQSEWAHSYAPSQDIEHIRYLWDNNFTCIVVCNGFRPPYSNLFFEAINNPKTNFSRHEPALVVLKIIGHAGKPLIADISFQPMMSSALSQGLLGNTRNARKQIDYINSNAYIHQFHIDHPGRGTFSFYAGNEYLGSVTIVKK